MTKTSLTAAMLLGSLGCAASVPGADTDTSKVEKINEIVVVGVKAKKDAPFAVSNIGKADLQGFSVTGKELPFLFARTPGVIAWGENGIGTGTSHMRIRGASDSRINVTLDGVALNSPEDQCVFWANMNSYGSLLGSAQLQRGVGTSTNGDGAFGGTVALTTKAPSMTPNAELSASYGSYNTFNIGGSLSTGLLWNHFVFDGAYHETQTDGYIHGTAGRSGSYYGGATYISTDGNLILRYKNIGNFESTGQAWNGVTAGNDDYSMNIYDGIKTYKDMHNAGMGRFNSLYEYFNPNWDGTWTTSRYKMADGSLWSKTTDNFWQNHNMLSLAWQIDDNWSTSGAVHYTHGYGYYEEFKYNCKLKKFGLSNFTDADGNTVKKSDFIRKKGLTQNTYGVVWNMNYKDSKWDVVGGLAMQTFEGNHYGYLTYAGNEQLRRMILADGDYQYYDSDAEKTDANIYAKATLHATEHLDIFGDIQYRHVKYVTTGINDKFYEVDGAYVNQVLDVNNKYDFFNPKAGLSYHAGGHTAYVSYARSHREPERNNFTDNGGSGFPKAESVNDYELGYSYTGKNWYANANLYYMDYDNQFVQTGAVSDIGEALTTNIKTSYRTGIELSAGYSPISWFTVEGNAALSSNKIKDLDEQVETYDNDWNSLPATTVHYNKSTLAFSPSVILNGFLDFHYKGFQAVWHTNFVSRQYLDNTENKDRSLPSYTTSNVNMNYTFDLAKRKLGIRNITVGANFSNIFGERYAASGWVYSSIVGTDHPVDNRYYQIGYMPMCGFTAMGSVTLRF